MRVIHTVRSSGRARVRTESQPQAADACASLAARPLGRAVRAAAMLFLALSLMATVAPGNAVAGSINVWACHGPDGQAVAPTDHWSSSITTSGIHTSNSCAGGGAGYLEITVDAVSHPGHANGTWKFVAPSGTTVTGFSYLRSAAVANWADATAFRSDLGVYDGPNIAETCGPPGNCSWAWAWSGWSLAHTPGVLLLLEACAQDGGCDGSSNGWYAISSAQVVLEDDSAPTFSTLTGSLASGSALRGSASLSFQLADSGVGIYQLHATVDGRSFDDRTLDTAGGRCVPITPGSRNFDYAVPCPLSDSAGTRLDTSTLTDGQHNVTVSVEDAAGNTTTVFNDTITTHNAPALVDRPQISGTASAGVPLAATAGNWSPTPTGYAYQWLRCPSTVTSPNDADACTTLPGATRSTYAPVDGDVYGRVMVRVTASDASGSDSTVSAPSDLVADAQGRTSPPVPDPGGSRDVIVVPVLPTPGGSSSTTIINQPAPGGGTSAIAGLVNPVAGPGHVANGTNASDGARIQIAFRTSSTKQVSVVRSTRNRRWVIAGRLLNAAGVPVGSGELVAAWQVNGRWTAHTGVRTRGDGRFTYILAKGPTRLVKFAFYAYSDSRTYSESNAIAEKVATPVTLVVRPHVTRTNGRSITFSGTVAPDFIPPDGVLVVLEASYPGSGWKKFQLVRAHRSGRFTASYRFSQTRQVTRYRLRAVAEKQADYPFEGGTSRPSEVLVTP